MNVLLSILGVIVVVFAIALGWFEGTIKREMKDPDYKDTVERSKKERERQQQADKDERERQQAWMDKWKG